MRIKSLYIIENTLQGELNSITVQGVGSIDYKKYLAELIDRYGNLVYSICYRITNDYFEAQDLTQETFLTVYKNLPTFDGKNERAWISTIATNKGLDYLKMAGRKMLPTEDTYFQVIESKDDGPEQTVLQHRVQEEFYELCKSLKPPYDEIAVDYFCQEMTVEEIAQKKGKKIKTVQTQIYRAKAMLKKLWGKEA